MSDKIPPPPPGFVLADAAGTPIDGTPPPPPGFVPIGPESRRPAVERLPEDPDFRAELDSSLSTFEKLMIGVGRGAVDVGEGIGQIGLQLGEAAGIVDPQTLENFEARAASGRETFAGGDLGAAGLAGRIAGNVATMAIPGAPLARATQMQRLAQMGRAGRMGANALAGAAAGGVQFVGEDESRIGQAAIGGLAGAVGGEIIGGLTNRLQAIGRRTARAFTRQARLKAAREAFNGANLPADDVARITEDIADGLTPEQALRKAEIEAFGAQPTRGRVTGNLDDLNAEQQLGRQQGPIADLNQRNRAAIAAKLDQRVRELSGESTDRLAAGDAVTASLTKGRNSVKAVERQAFEAAQEALEEIGEETPVITDRLRAVISEELDNLALPESSALVSALKRQGLMNAQGELVEGAALTPARAAVLRKTIQRATAPREAGVIQGKLRRALDDDIVDSLGEDVFADARAVSRERFRVFDNRERVKAIIDGKIAPERLVPTLQQPSFTVKQTRELFDSLAEAGRKRAADVQLVRATPGRLEAPGTGTNLTPDEIAEFLDYLKPDGLGPLNNLRAAVLDDLFTQLRGAADIDGVPTFSTRAFEKRLDTIGNAKLDAIFGNGSAARLRKDLDTIRRITLTDFRIKDPGTAAELSKRVRGAFASLLEGFPGGRWVVGLGRAAADGAKSRETERAIRKALNAELIKAENVAAEVLGSRASPAIAAGSAAAVTAP